MVKPVVNIAHIVLTMEAGGLESVVYDLCRATDRREYRPEILCLQRHDDKYVAMLAAEGIPVTLMEKRCKFDFAYFFRVASYLRRRKINIIHTHSGCFFYAAIFALLARCGGFIYTAHGLPILNRLQDIVEDNFAAWRCDQIIAVSEEVADVLKCRMPLAKKKIVCLINGIDTAKYQPLTGSIERSQLRKKFQIPETGLLIGTVGRLAVEKNYQMLLRAFWHFNNSCPEQLKHLVFIGDGGQREQLMTLRAELGLTEHVTFLGNQYNIETLLPMLDVFVLSSRTEGTSISLLEAQACSIPAVVTDVGGNGQVIADGITGFLCPLDDVETMANRFRLLASQPEMMRAMGMAARKRVVEKFSLQKMANDYVETYKKIDS